MPRDLEGEVYRAHREAQNRYTYFLLAAAGAMIAVSVNQTEEAELSWFQIPLAAAVACWGLSFISGCKHLLYVQSTIFANMALLQAESGRHPEAGRHPGLMEAAKEGIKSAIEENDRRGSCWARWQFRLLVYGAVFFLAWHVVEMYLRTVST